MEQNTCSCNRWELTGIPCKYSIAAIRNMRLNNENVGIPETWVHPTYWLKTWKEMYVFRVEPINGRFLWEKSTCPTKLIPPKYRVPIGRPKKVKKICNRRWSVHKMEICQGAAGSSGGVKKGVGNKGKIPML
uniref:Zinc finger PMZ-type domain-containing protein n=1 Tax=Lactuca sativa TaxID=4236 RepID=A0A9R1VA45_LACSA|nr:hypothetical protein LSAT_V11C500287190 [Lactuca sativa]